MANVKQIEIKGLMAFDANGRDDVLKFLGWLNLPTIGFKITWNNWVYMDNPWGGQTCLYRYEITGHEAVSADAIRNDIKKMEFAGRVESAKYRDIQEDRCWTVVETSRATVIRNPLEHL